MKVCLYPGCRERRGATAFCAPHVLDAALYYLPAGAEYLDFEGWMEVWGPIRMGLEEAKLEELGR